MGEAWVVAEPLWREHQKAMTQLAATTSSMSSLMSSQSHARLIHAHRSCCDGSSPRRRGGLLVPGDFRRHSACSVTLPVGAC